MTDRHTAYIVTLEAPIRDDDAQPTIDAIRQIKGVLDVRPVIAGMEQMSGAVRMDHEWRNALIQLVQNGTKPNE
ncbi:hypothetical protein [Oceaniglobus trochenteri]|uniref:hypothetical protein n=1 Tax=Oceaniglobus trochenteri TaxID=2763260 RepID=UPI001CFF6926|nr:hypothetical protein [Oceaniglobus trochenteri]